MTRCRPLADLSHRSARPAWPAWLLFLACVHAGAQSPGSGYANNLFRQSVAEAAQAANDPRATARLAAQATARQDEASRLTANGQQRQAAIISSALGNTTNLINAAANGGRSTTMLGAASEALSSAQRYADGGMTGGAMAGRDLGGTPGGGEMTIGPNTAIVGPPHGGSCAAGQDALEREINGINAQPPAPSMLGTYQRMLWILQRTVNQLSSEPCANDAKAAADLAQIHQSYAIAMQNCRQVASDVSRCTPTRNW